MVVKKKTGSGIITATTSSNLPQLQFSRPKKKNNNKKRQRKTKQQTQGKDRNRPRKVLPDTANTCKNIVVA